jgi:hypothetical protein
MERRIRVPNVAESLEAHHTYNPDFDHAWLEQ